MLKMHYFFVPCIVLMAISTVCSSLSFAQDPQAMALAYAKIDEVAKQYDKALATYQQILQSDYANIAAHEGAIRCAQQLDMRDRSAKLDAMISEYSKNIEKMPRLTTSYYGKGFCYLIRCKSSPSAASSKKDLVLAFNKILELDPSGDSAAAKRLFELREMPEYETFLEDVTFPSRGFPWLANVVLVLAIGSQAIYMAYSRKKKKK
jgi:tetratricopeptide (TPR) repeat protein